MNYAGGSIVSGQLSSYQSNYLFTDQASSTMPSPWVGPPIHGVVSVIASTIGTDSNRYAL